LDGEAVFLVLAEGEKEELPVAIEDRSGEGEAGGEEFGFWEGQSDADAERYEQKGEQEQEEGGSGGSP
jgi:hypothetical protein